MKLAIRQVIPGSSVGKVTRKVYFFSLKVILQVIQEKAHVSCSSSIPGAATGSKMPHYPVHIPYSRMKERPKEQLLLFLSATVLHLCKD